MVQTGETPAKADDEEALEEVHEVTSGQTVYDEDGNVLGRVRSFEQSGFFVTTREGAEAMSIEHARSGHEFGEAHLMWRCMECGEMGGITADLPDECPNCQTGRENLMYWTED
ncbi:hypothetical protein CHINAEXTREME_04005 [Halobiforma lacisalsi AJ5]|uniref:DUF7130 domain-containing protein n=1 Tax=Natronobacterium lacisalsi AJ5 TaxID=358396 RepID=M0LNK8_NATLA|nr:hypothetical protein [Halobiforma lacisalsi]APW96984.1 hypothetical protein CHINAEXTREME_04005 [Halobiforma lacisalsi AJ5]EMA34698.1 hypothetical protein C445_07250 [Halobiforma lacisalsi AJ5]